MKTREVRSLRISHTQHSNGTEELFRNLYYSRTKLLTKLPNEGRFGGLTMQHARDGSTYRILAGKPEEDTDNIKIDLQRYRVQCVGVYWIKVAQ